MQRGPAPTPSGITGWLVLLWVSWVLVPGGLFAAASGSLLTFFGELPTDAEQADARRLIVLAGVAAVAIPVIGLVLSVRARRQGSVAAFVLAGGLASIVTVVLVVGTARSAPRSSLPRHDPGGACQELSGGDNRCPGD